MKKIMMICSLFLLMTTIIPIEGEDKNYARPSQDHKMSNEVAKKIEEALKKINEKYAFIDEEENKALKIRKKTEKLISKTYAKLLQSEQGQMYIIAEQHINDYIVKNKSYVGIPQELYEARKNAVMNLAETEVFQTFLSLQIQYKYYWYKIVCLRHIRHGAGYEPINHYCSSEKECNLAVLNSLKNNPEFKGTKPSYCSLEDIIDTETIYQDVENEIRNFIDQIGLRFPDVLG